MPTGQLCGRRGLPSSAGASVSVTNVGCSRTITQTEAAVLLWVFSGLALELRNLAVLNQSLLFQLEAIPG